MLPITMVARMFILMTEDFKRIIVVLLWIVSSGVASGSSANDTANHCND